MTTTCATCRWFDPEFAPDDDPDEALGLCHYPQTRLPLSEQGVPSERRPVRPNEVNCPCYTPKVC